MRGTCTLVVLTDKSCSVYDMYMYGPMGCVEGILNTPYTVTPHHPHMDWISFILHCPFALHPCHLSSPRGWASRWSVERNKLEELERNKRKQRELDDELRMLKARENQLRDEVVEPQ